MSDDQWNNPNQPANPNAPTGGSQNGWDVESDLPKPGDSWDNAHAPKPLHQVNEDEWGTAPFDGSVQNPAGPQQQQQSPQQFGQPGPPQGNPYQGAPPQGQGMPPQGAPYQGAPSQPNAYPSPQGGYPQAYQPNTAMTTNQLDNNDIIAIVLSIFVPGAGHIMLGQTAKGIAILASIFLTCGLAAMIWPVFIIDAVMVAQARKKRPVGDWELFPK